MLSPAEISAKEYSPEGTPPDGTKAVPCSRQMRTVTYYCQGANWRRPCAQIHVKTLKCQGSNERDRWPVRLWPGELAHASLYSLGDIRPALPRSLTVRTAPRLRLVPSLECSANSTHDTERQGRSEHHLHLHVRLQLQFPVEGALSSTSREVHNCALTLKPWLAFSTTLQFPLVLDHARPYSLITFIPRIICASEATKGRHS